MSLSFLSERIPRMPKITYGIAGTGAIIMLIHGIWLLTPSPENWWYFMVLGPLVPWAIWLIQKAQSRNLMEFPLAGALSLVSFIAGQTLEWDIAWLKLVIWPWIALAVWIAIKFSWWFQSNPELEDARRLSGKLFKILFWTFVLGEAGFLVWRFQTVAGGIAAFLNLYVFFWCYRSWSRARQEENRKTFCVSPHPVWILVVWWKWTLGKFPSSSEMEGGRSGKSRKSPFLFRLLIPTLFYSVVAITLGALTGNLLSGNWKILFLSIVWWKWIAGWLLSIPLFWIILGWPRARYRLVRENIPQVKIERPSIGWFEMQTEQLYNNVEVFDRGTSKTCWPFKALFWDPGVYARGGGGEVREPMVFCGCPPAFQEAVLAARG